MFTYAANAGRSSGRATQELCGQGSLGDSLVKSFRRTRRVAMAQFIGAVLGHQKMQDDRTYTLPRTPFLDNLHVADVRILPCSIIRRAQQMGFRSCSLVTESMHGIDAAGSPRRYEASRTSRRREHQACRHEGEWVVRL